MTQNITNKVERLAEIADELFEMANSLAGNETGTVAAHLHGTRNRIWDSIRMFKEGVTVADSDKLADKWCDNQAMPMGERQRAVIKSLLRAAA